MYHLRNCIYTYCTAVLRRTANRSKQFLTYKTFTLRYCTVRHIPFKICTVPLAIEKFVLDLGENNNI